MSLGLAICCFIVLGVWAYVSDNKRMGNMVAVNKIGILIFIIFALVSCVASAMY